METAKTVAAKIAEWKRAGFSKAQIIQNAAACCIGWPYVWASNGERCTPGWRKNRIPYCREQKYADAIRNNCSVLSGNREQCAGCKWDGCLCFDCQGFVHWLLEQVGVPLYGGGATTQWNTASNWAVKGEIKDMPPGLVCCVFKRKEDKMSHTGLSMGDGSGGIIHCSTTVKRDTLPGKPAWTHWAIPAGLYTTEELRKAGISVDETRNTPTLRKGSGGDNVEELQAVLNAKYGAALEADGIFGAKTEQAVKAFQSAKGLTADGVVGPKTWDALGISPGAAEQAAAQEPAPEETEQPESGVFLAADEWRTIKAAFATAQNIIKKYE